MEKKEQHMKINNTNSNNNKFILKAKGKTLQQVFDENDFIGAIKRTSEYREKHNLPLLYDIYKQQKDGTFILKKGININD